MAQNRRLDWDGFVNARDLGGLRTRDGRVTCSGAVVRSDHPARLSAAGWEALLAYGIRTIITLRTKGMVEDIPDQAPRPPGLVNLQVEIEDVTDAEFVSKWVESGLWSTPIYYRDALQRWPQRHAAVLSAIAHAQPGGVLFHCVRGVDRTGIVALLLLSAAGVVTEDILADYELSLDPDREQILASQGTSTREVIQATLDSFVIEEYLQRGGLGSADLAALRARLL